MTLSEIRNKVCENVGNNVTIRYNMGRNKVERYDVKIRETYKNIFIVEANNGDKTEIKSFSYTDVMTKTIKIDY